MLDVGSYAGGFNPAEDEGSDAFRGSGHTTTENVVCGGKWLKGVLKEVHFLSGGDRGMATESVEDG